MTEVISSFNPITQDIIGSVPTTPIESISGVLKKSTLAQGRWRNLRISERSKILTRARKVLVKRSEEFITLISEETGKPYWDSFLEVVTVSEHLKYVCSHAPFILSKEDRSSGIFLHKKSYVQYSPIGLIGGLAHFTRTVYF